MTKQPEQIVAAAAGKIDEQLLAAAFAKPRGATTAAATGGVAREIGSQWSGKHHKDAAAAGIEIGNPGAIAVTPTSLVTMSVGSASAARSRRSRRSSASSRSPTSTRSR